MSRLKSPDITNQKFGTLTALSRVSNGRGKWLCRCNCGNLTTPTSRALIKGRVKGCSCNRSGFRKYSRVDSSWHRLLSEYKGNAKAKDLEFKLSFEKFKELCSENCYLCGSQPQYRKVCSNGDPIAVSGIDRLNTEKGYYPENCKPCCYTCNRMKMDHSLTATLRHMKKVLIHARIIEA